MGGAGLQFVNIQECEIFLVRYFSREFEDRAFFLPSQIDTLKTIEKSCKAASSWRMDSDHCASVALNFHEVPEVKMLINKLSEVDIQCGGCKSVSTFCGHFGIVPKFMNDEERDETGSKMRQCIDLLLCLLSPAVDYRDVWSVARFFGRVCAKVLPPLRRRAEQTSGHLNIMSVLLSYVMTSVLDGTGGDDPILSANFAVLKNFTDTITKMTDLLQDDLHPTVAIREMVTTAVTYLRSLKCFTGLTELCKVQKFVTKQLANIEANFATLSALACNDYQV
ncbi:unnamed protein product [Toxocara canis]|uniref:Protein SHOOT GRAVITROPISM 6 n=1 Tax=Toxocara canis TaxID=6265 RepID=A0A183U0U2_TOXCA|nr:unnamed protein product [Toxocara canis]